MAEDDKVHRFLMGLDDDVYSSVQFQILILDPPLSLDKNFSMVQQEENHKKVMSKREHKLENAATFSISHINKGAQYGGDPMSCKKLRYKVVVYYELAGYPTS